MEQVHQDEMTVSDFLQGFAVPSFREFCKLEEEIAASVSTLPLLPRHDPRFVSLRLAGATAAVWVFHVLDWHWHARRGAPKSIKWEKFKTDFLARYPQVNAASDIADAAKHCTLNKAARHPPKFDFVCLAAIERRWDDPGINWDEGHYWDGAPCLVAYDSNRNAIGVRHVLQRTINLWLTMESEGRL